MTADELTDLAKIAATVARIEERMDKVERWMDRIDGALTVGKWIVGLFGATGIAAVVWALAQK